MKYIIIFFILFISLPSFAQKATSIKLLSADNGGSVVYKGKKAMRLTGNVRFKHKKTILKSDTAYLYQLENSLDAYGHVYINDNDSIHIYGDTLHYNGNTGIAELHNRVRLRDKKMTLTTNHMVYSVRTKVANYYNGGKIVTDDNVLVSEFGYYYSRSQDFYYQKNVVLTNPSYVMTSDTLRYNVQSKTSFFQGPTWIKSDDNAIYCENGWYNTNTDISQYDKNAVIYNKDQSLTADSLYYDRKKGVGLGFNNVKLVDTVKNVIMQGNYAEYYEHGTSSFFTDSAMATIISDDEDSLFLHSDTLRIVFDSAQKVEQMQCYQRTKFYRDDMQGKCDSLVYLFKDSVLEMYGSPLLWGNKSQLSGKFIYLTIANGNVDRMYIDTNAFVLSKDTIEYFNQVSGRDMIVFFKNNELQRADVYGNAQSIYFVRNEANELIGVNLSTSSDLRVNLDTSGIKDIIYLHKPNVSLNPVKNLSQRELHLKGFRNQEAIRPKSKLEIFNWE
jgi:lipopolysaccharide export system protein LptA